MSEQHKIELAFSRPRFALIIGTAVVTGLGLLAIGLFAGIEVGSVKRGPRYRRHLRHLRGIQRPYRCSLLTNYR